MTRKYVPPKKKKNRQVTNINTRLPESAPAEAEVVAVSAGTTKVAPAAITAADAVKYGSLSKELLRVAVLSALTMAIIIVLWLILR